MTRPRWPDAPPRPKPQPIRMAPMFTSTLLDGHKIETRRVISAANTVQSAGTFADLRLEGAGLLTGPYPNYIALRCRCEIGQQVRTVKVFPTVKPGSLLWVREGQAGKRATKKGSRITLGVLSVKAQRLQAIQDHEAIAEGVCDIGEQENPLAPWRGNSGATLSHDWLTNQLPRVSRQQYLASNRFREIVMRGCPTPRDAFAVLWDLLNGYGAWAENPWVWVYRFHVFPGNVVTLSKSE